MKKILLLVLLTAFAVFHAAAQSAKTRPPLKGPAPVREHPKMRPWPGKATVPPASNPFGLPRAAYQPIGTFSPPATRTEQLQTERGENGLPIFFQGRTAASNASDAGKNPGERALDYLESLKPAGLARPKEEFAVRHVETDEQGNLHVRLEQQYGGLPVHGGELIAHTRDGAFDRLNGRYYPSPELPNLTPALSADAAVQKVLAALGPENVKTGWTPQERMLIGGQERRTELVIYHHGRAPEAERLAWHVVLYPNPLRREVFFVDARNGEILHHFDHTCEIGGPGAAAGAGGPVMASGLDLKNQNRTFGAWMEGAAIYLEDAGQPMFNANAAQMPSSPVGVVVTLDAHNTSPEVQATFDFDLVTSGTTVFSNKNAVSTHWNAIQSYSYFQAAHARNSIDGVGGNIISLFNVSNADGTSMGNAFWNGSAMWYGNGDQTFTELAGGLDVGGHEMTHGVIEQTANLEYQYESGALNESFADVFAVCIDRGDWKIGEDVVRPLTTTDDCLRNMQFPNSSTPSQPKHVSEQYFGPQDNGGVHINSGIPNRAFYLFATNPAVGLDKAEKVYYKALRDYLVKSSQFVDCRLAVIQAAGDLYGPAVATAAADAFSAVGIVGSQPGGNYLGELAVNPGSDFIVCVSADGQNLDLYNGGGQFVARLYDEGVASRPSVTDKGHQIVFVNPAGHIVGVDLIYNGAQLEDFFASEISFFPDWRGAAISKDGRFLAALSKFEDNRIEIVDLADALLNSEVFFLYNPTYTTGQITGEVRYADVLEFDYSGEYLMYDAYNELNNGQGEDLSYWDIGFLRFWENDQFVDGASAFITKLFSGLPDRYSVGNPTFAKNAPFVIAFDLFNTEESFYDVLGANTETGDWNYLVFDNGELGWPGYTRQDDYIMFQHTFGNGINLFVRPIDADRITGIGTTANLVVTDHDTGVWYANGTRSLLVDTDEPAAAGRLQLQAAPNPATDRLQLSFETPAAGPVRALVSDLMGRTVQTREWPALPAGRNQLEIDLRTLPAGVYVVRLQAGAAGAALRVMKQ